MTAMTAMTYIITEGHFLLQDSKWDRKKQTHPPSRNPNEKRKNQKKAGPMALLVI